MPLEVFRTLSNALSPTAAGGQEEKGHVAIDVKRDGLGGLMRQRGEVPQAPVAGTQSYVPLHLVQARIGVLRKELVQTKQKHAALIGSMAEAYEKATHDNRMACQTVLDDVRSRAQKELQSQRDVIAKLASEKKRLAEKAKGGGVFVGGADNAVELEKLRIARDDLSSRLERAKREDEELRATLADKSEQLTQALASATGNADDASKLAITNLQVELKTLQTKNDDLREQVSQAEADARTAKEAAAAASVAAAAAAAAAAVVDDDDDDEAKEPLPAQAESTAQKLHLEPDKLDTNDFTSLRKLCGVWTANVDLKKELKKVQASHEATNKKKQALSEEKKAKEKEITELKAKKSDDTEAVKALAALTEKYAASKKELKNIQAKHKELKQAYTEGEAQRTALMEKYELKNEQGELQKLSTADRQELLNLVGVLEERKSQPKKKKAPKAKLAAASALAAPAPVATSGVSAAEAAATAAKIAAVTEQLTGKEEELRQTSERLAERDAELSGLREKVAEMTKELALKTSQVDSLTAGLAAAQGDLTALQAADDENAKIKVWKDKATSLEERLGELAQQVQEHAVAEADWTTQRDDLKRNVKDLEEAKAKTETALTQKTKELALAQTQAATASAAASSATATPASAPAPAAAVAAAPAPVVVPVAAAGGGGASSEELAALQSQVNALQTSSQELEQKLQEANAKVAELEQANTDLGVKASANGKELQVKLTAEFQGKIDVLQKEADELRVEVEKQTAEATRLQGELSAEITAKKALEVSVSNLEAEKKELQESSADAVGAMEKLKATIAEQAAEMKEKESAIESLEAKGAEASQALEKSEEMLRQETTRRKEFQFKYEEVKGKVRVYSRVRPMSSMEVSKQEERAIRMGPNAWTIELDQKQTDLSGNVKEKWRAFQFDSIFLAGVNGTQKEVFAECETFGEMSAQGINACIFAYGQSGTGKTFTMAGKRDPPELRGLKPRFIDFIYALAEKNKKQFTYRISCYMVEIYLNKLQDLFWKLEQTQKKGKKQSAWDEAPELRVRTDRKKKVTVENVVIKEFPTAAEMHEFTDEAETTRQVRATGLNEESSRSHLIFALCIEATDKKSGKVTRGKLSLCDLAGSERADKTNVEGLNDKQRQKMLEEGRSINESLRMLKNVFLVLGQESGVSDKKKKAVVQYRGNMLTELMQDSLGGNARTLMFVNVGPAASNVPESIDSLQYGDYVKNITNEVAGEDADHLEQIRFLKEQLAAYKAKHGALS